MNMNRRNSSLKTTLLRSELAYLGGLGTLGGLVAFGALVALDAFVTFDAFFTLFALGALGGLVALGTLVALIAFGSLFIWVALVVLDAWGVLGTLVARIAWVALVVLDVLGLGLRIVAALFAPRRQSGFKSNVSSPLHQRSWDLRLVDMLTRLLPPVAREEWIGELIEERQGLIEQQYSTRYIRLHTCQRTLELVLALARAKVDELWKRII